MNKNIYADEDYQALIKFENSLPLIEKKLNKWDYEVNIFDILKIKRIEIRHSNFLAWMMNPRENHCFSDYFIRALLKKIGSMYDGISVKKLSDKSYIDAVVYREKKHIDILIISEKNKLNMVIENKVDANEADNQLESYYRYIEEEYPEAKGYTNIFLYLTPTKAKASHSKYLLIGYEDIFDILNTVLFEKSETIDSKVKFLIHDYIAILRRDILKDKDLINLCNKVYAEHGRAIDLINENRTDIRSELSEIMQSSLNELLIDKKINGLLFNQRFSNRTRICFQTKRMSSILDSSTKGSKWKDNCYFYEIYNNDNEKIKVKLTITNDVKKEWRQAIDSLIEVIEGSYSKWGFLFLKEWDIPNISDLVIENSTIESSMKFPDDFKKQFSKFYLNELVPFEESIIRKIK